MGPFCAASSNYSADHPLTPRTDLEKVMGQGAAFRAVFRFCVTVTSDRKGLFYYKICGKMFYYKLYSVGMLYYLLSIIYKCCRFWFIILGILSGLALVYSAAVLLLPSIRETILIRRFRFGTPSGVSALIRKTQVCEKFYP